MGCGASYENEMVFTSCFKNWIVALQKLPDTKTNESRSNVKNPKYAKFMADKLMVIGIVHKLDPYQKTNAITNSKSRYQSILFKKGEIVWAPYFDENSDEAYGEGIEYFKSYEAAFHDEMPDNYSGTYKLWYATGNLCVQCTIKNGKKDGLYKQWYGDGDPWYECFYENEKENGVSKLWLKSCGRYEESIYKDGIKQ
jgi:hypothetical protein